MNNNINSNHGFVSEFWGKARWRPPGECRVISHCRCRVRYDFRAKTHLQWRMEEDKTKTEVIRCLNRYVAREVFRIIHDIGIQHAVQDA